MRLTCGQSPERKPTSRDATGRNQHAVARRYRRDWQPVLRQVVNIISAKHPGVKACAVREPVSGFARLGLAGHVKERYGFEQAIGARSRRSGQNKKHSKRSGK